jgi:hypothetical protein
VTHIARLIGPITLLGTLFTGGPLYAQVDANAGLLLARQLCSECHAVERGPGGPSPNPASPPFETIANVPGMTAHCALRGLAKSASVDAQCDARQQPAPQHRRLCAQPPAGPTSDATQPLQHWRYDRAEDLRVTGGTGDRSHDRLWRYTGRRCQSRTSAGAALVCDLPRRSRSSATTNRRSSSVCDDREAKGLQLHSAHELPAQSPPHDAEHVADPHGSR